MKVLIVHLESPHMSQIRSISDIRDILGLNLQESKAFNKNLVEKLGNSIWMEKEQADRFAKAHWYCHYKLKSEVDAENNESYKQKLLEAEAWAKTLTDKEQEYIITLIQSYTPTAG